MPKKKNSPKVTNEQFVKTALEMLSYRSIDFDSHEKIKMSHYWRELASDVPEISIKLHKGTGTRAGVISLGDLSTLVAPNELFEKVDNGSRLDNFTLAHEFTHLALDHGKDSQKIKNFMLQKKGAVNVVSPPTVEELEADIGAVFFLCGESLFHSNKSDLELGKQFLCEPNYIGKIRERLAWDSVKAGFEASSNSKKRVVF